MNNKKSNRGEDEVEQLLQAAQDELLLKLSVDSHMSRVSPDYLLPDLDRRFQALKSPPPFYAATPNHKQAPPPNNDDHLFPRFAALKASSSITAGDEFHPDSDGDNEEDEVEKIIRWAKDAARLDPSPPSDEDTTYREDEDDSRMDKRKKAQPK